jgi:predicted RNA-binding protein with PIN domain
MPSALNLAKLEDQRCHLIRFIEQRRPQGSANNRVTIVFDGNIDVFGGMQSSTAKIIFSQNGSADDEIKKIVAQVKNAKDIVVVSDDRDIQYAVRALGAKVSRVRDFLNKGKTLGRNGLAQRDSGYGHSLDQGKYISQHDESMITSEFSQLWLDPKRKRK